MYDFSKVAISAAKPWCERGNGYEDSDEFILLLSDLNTDTVTVSIELLTI